MKHDISKVINRLIDYNPDFAKRGDWMLVHWWIDEGADLEKDILPAIEECIRRKPGIASISYFRPAVERRKENRLLFEKAAKTFVKEVVSDEMKARNIAFKRKMNIFINAHDEAFLLGYELKNGEVKV